MWPGFTIPGIGVTTSSYHLLHVVAWFAFYFAGSNLTRSRPDLVRHWFWLAVGFGLCDTVGARYAFRLIHGRHESGFFGTPVLFAAWTGAYVLVRRVRAYPFLDAWAIAFSAAHVFEKLSCLAAGCCFGRSTTAWYGLAVHAAEGDPRRWVPLPPLEAGLHLASALGLGWLYARGYAKGRLVMVLGLGYGLWRSAVEMARAGQSSAFLDGPLTLTQVACVLAMAFSLTYLLISKEADSADRPTGGPRLGDLGAPR